MPTLVKSRDREPDLSAFTDEQRQQILALWAADIEDRVTRLDALLEAVFRACIGVARTIKPGKRWDGL